MAPWRFVHVLKLNVGSWPVHAVEVTNVQNYRASQGGILSVQSELNLNETEARAATDRCDNPDTVTSFDKTAITNIFAPGDGRPSSERPRLWVHLIVLWFIVLLVLKVRCPGCSRLLCVASRCTILHVTLHVVLQSLQAAVHPRSHARHAEHAKHRL